MSSWYIIVIGMTLLGSLGGLYFKRSTEQGISINRTFILNMGVGGFFYLASAVLNIIVLHHLNYSIVYPMTSITYIWTLILSFIILKETLTLRKILGVLMIIIGTFVLIG